MDETKKIIPEDNQESSSADSQKTETPDSLSDAYKKVLKEKKNAMERLRELEQQLKSTQEKELIRKEEFKILAETKEKEAVEWKSKFESTQKVIKDSIKANKLREELAKLGMQSSYMNDAIKLVDLNTIDFDEDTRIITGADSAAKMLNEKFPPLFGSNNAKVSHSVPDTREPRPITLDEWKKLPPKEQKERERDLYTSLGIKRMM